MANFTLELAFKKLSIRPSQLCRQCRRSFASTTSRQETNMSATRAFSEQLQSSLRSTPTATSRANPNPPLPTASPSPTVPAGRPSSASTVTIPPSQRTSHEIAASMIKDSTARKAELAAEQRERDLARDYTVADLERQQIRKWKVGDVYAPHDLTGVEQAKWKKLRRRGKQKYDVVDQLGLDPREHYKNFMIMSEYMTDMGRIKHSRETGLRPKNQRRMAKAIRRAIGIGLMPGVHKHPELLRIETNKRQGMPG